MNTSVELKKYHIMEYLMNISDINLLDKVEKMIIDSGELSQKEMNKRALIAEKQWETGEYKTNDQVKERLSKWIK